MIKRIIFIFFPVLQSLQAQPIQILEKKGSLAVVYDGRERLQGGKVAWKNHADVDQAKLTSKVVEGVMLLSVNLEQGIDWTAEDEAGISFANPSGFQQGVCIWRYKPWNSWTKPIALHAASDMPDWDVQFFYWQYADGLYGAAIPLSDGFCRTTLGAHPGGWGSKAMSYASIKSLHHLPAMAIAFGKNPFEVFERLYRVGLTAMGKGSNLVSKKKYPEPFNYIGWCSWNSSGNGSKLDEALVVNAVKTFTDHDFRLGWVLIDDGWFQQQHSQLQSFYPNSARFPNGFKPMINRLKHDFGIRYAGIWHAFDGYWNGIDPESAFGKQYAGQLFSWKQKDGDSIKKYFFFNPSSDSLKDFFDDWHRYLREQGFDFVKVDNQLVNERMALNNFPIMQLSDSIHRALYHSVNKYFGGAIINCMDMTADAYLNFGSSAVARGVEDYFPYKAGETYNLQEGNAAAHVLQAVYNNIYFSKMVFTDFDMFQSHNPNAIFHAIARSINNGPIYLTDNPGEQHFDVLNKMVYSDGRIIHSTTPLLPTADCLFQVQTFKPFKAWSKSGNAGLLGIWNAADTSIVKGSFCAADLSDVQGTQFALYEHFSQSILIVNKQQQVPVSLDRLGYQLYYVVPLVRGFAAFGLTNKYNAPATITSTSWDKTGVNLRLYEGGHFAACCTKKPSSVLANGKILPYSIKDHLLSMEIPKGNNILLRIEWHAN